MKAPKDAFIHLRVSADLLAAVKRVAAAEGRPVANWVKFQIQKALMEKPTKRAK
jgi:predicted DNA binding CopG/RHH family protein